MRMCIRRWVRIRITIICVRDHIRNIIRIIRNRMIRRIRRRFRNIV